MGIDMLVSVQTLYCTCIHTQMYNINQADTADWISMRMEKSDSFNINTPIHYHVSSRLPHL